MMLNRCQMTTLINMISKYRDSLFERQWNYAPSFISPSIPTRFYFYNDFEDHGGTKCKMHDFSLFSHHKTIQEGNSNTNQALWWTVNQNHGEYNVCSPGLHEFLCPQPIIISKAEIGIVLWRRETNIKKNKTENVWENFSSKEIKFKYIKFPWSVIRD